MKKVIKLTEKDLTRIVKRVIKESMWASTSTWDDLSSPKKDKTTSSEKDRPSSKETEILNELKDKIDKVDVDNLTKEVIDGMNKYIVSGYFDGHDLDYVYDSNVDLILKVVDEKSDYLKNKYNLNDDELEMIYSVVYFDFNRKKDLPGEGMDLFEKLFRRYYVPEGTEEKWVFRKKKNSEDIYHKRYPWAKEMKKN